MPGVMPIAELIERLEHAQALIDRHGLTSRNAEAKKGITIGAALALSDLPDDLPEKVAFVVAQPGKRLLGIAEDLETAADHYAGKTASITARTP